MSTANTPATAIAPTTPETETSDTQQQQQHLLLPPSILSPTAPATFPADFDFASLTGAWYMTHTSSSVWRDKRNVVVTYTPLSALPPVGASSSVTANPAQAPTWPVLEDRVTYQSLTGEKVDVLLGTDTPQPPSPPASTSSSSSASTSGFSLGGWGRRAAAAATAPLSSSEPSAPADAGRAPRVWLWRGTGLLKLVTSRWEIIGYGPPLPADADTDTDTGDAAAAAGAPHHHHHQRTAWMVVFAQKTILSPNIVNICTRDKAGVGPDVKEHVRRVLTGWARGDGGEGVAGAKGLEVLEGCVNEFYDVRHD